MTERSFVVLKFGGTSVNRLERWETIAAVARERLAENLRPVLVCSAISGVTNLLEALLDSAVAGEYSSEMGMIRDRHRAMATELGIDPSPEIGLLLDELEKLANGISLIGEVSARVRARVMATGELLSTRLGGRYLNGNGVRCAWIDARDLLCTVEQDGSNRSYLQASCATSRDAAAAGAVNGLDGDVILTQGFIAKNRTGETVLLGRGGSDTTAAYLAAKLGAVRCEIWTDVPGIYTADPRDVPQARLLRSLDYDEAQEIATCGAGVLHPRCLGPLRDSGIPCHIRCTPRPELEGTVIGRHGAPDSPGVKALSSKSKVALVSMDTLGMWGHSGFLADAFACFRNRQISVDLVSTSESNVTASFDASLLKEDPGLADRLLEDLGKVCNARMIGPCSAVSLVGRGIRAILHQLGPALELFEEHRIHLVSQAASDLNLTFVVDDDQAPRRVEKLHALLFEAGGIDLVLGPTWAETFEAVPGPGPGTPAGDDWWADRRTDLLEIAVGGTPVYVYHRPTVESAVRELTSLKAVDRVFYAMKANPHEEILQWLHHQGIGIECVSPGEMRRAFEAIPDLAADDLLFTPNFAPREEYEQAFRIGVRVNVDSLYPLQHWPETFRNREFFLRIDPGHGQGHHAHVRTAGPRSKFGIAPEEVAAAAEAVRACGGRVTGLHAHAGSGIRDGGSWAETARFLGQTAGRFQHVRVLDLGGGFGIVEKPGQRPLDLEELDRSLLAFRQAFPGYELWLEPGRFLVASAGVLLAQATQTKQKGEVHYIGLDAGMHTLIRPALYGAYHRIVNLTRLGEEESVTANIVGPICETGDMLGRGRRIAPTEAGEVFLIACAGAYGRAMSSDYNLRGRPRERTLDR